MSWWTTFTAFSLQHLIVAGAFLGAVIGVGWLGHYWKANNPKREYRLRIVWVVALVIFNGYSQYWWFLPPQFTWDYSLPLHICDLTVWIAPFALFMPYRWPQAIVYFWGLGMSLMAFVFPPFEDGLNSMRFWLYWVGHSQIVGSALYLPFAMGYRPKLADAWFAGMAILLYDLIMLPLNMAFQWDYGYVGPESKVVGWLGPWPWRVILLVGLELLAVMFLWLPWRKKTIVFAQGGRGGGNKED